MKGTKILFNDFVEVFFQYSTMAANNAKPQ